MKTTNKFLALVLMAVAMVFTSCSKDDDNDPVVPTQQEIETKIIGKWKNVTCNGQKVLTNDRAVATYFKDGTQIVSVSNVGMWWNKESFTWSVDGNIVCNKPVGVGMTQFN